jgi:hypothetical protein
MVSKSAWKRYTTLLILLVGGSISLLWGIALERGSRTGIMGFPGIYLGTKCLLQKCDPYSSQELQGFYERQGIAPHSESTALRQSVTLYVNLPSTFLFIAPFAFLPLHFAQLLWMVLVVGTFFTATFLMWQSGATYASDVSTILALILLVNCEIIFSGGNTAGLVVGLCVIAVWCFLNERHVVLGVLCLAVGLAIKPHDSGLIWLYFLIAAPAHRKRAIASAALAIALCLVAVLWVSLVAPHWLPEFQANMKTISSPGGINEPGPTSIGGASPDMIIDLQTVIGVFVDKPGIYNLASYVICGILLITWIAAVRSTTPTPRSALFALVSAAAMSMLVTYHRSYDAKLLLLSIPACAILWAERKPIRWIAFALSAASILMTGDIALALLTNSMRNSLLYTGSLTERTLFVLVARPAPILLLATAVFYQWVMYRHPRAD